MQNTLTDKMDQGVWKIFNSLLREGWDGAVQWQGGVYSVFQQITLPMKLIPTPSQGRESHWPPFLFLLNAYNTMINN
jgi:hypothetical protein